MPDTLTVRLVRLVLVVGAIAVPIGIATPAGAAVGAFSLSPSSGPAGTVVSVNGTGCAPGFLLSSTLDYVQIAATTVPPVTARIAVAANGSWHGTFTVPANVAAAPAAVTALCFSAGLQSLLTLYTPKTFTVTAGASAPTIPPTTIAPSGPSVGPIVTPITTPHRPSTPSTRAPTTTAPTSGTPSTGGPATPTAPSATPGANTGSGTPPGVSPRSPAARTTTSAGNGPSGHDKASVEPVVYAADLSVPGSVHVDGSGGSGGLGWLLWLLLATALALVLAPFGWRWMRGAEEPAEPTEP